MYTKLMSVPNMWGTDISCVHIALCVYIYLPTISVCVLPALTPTWKEGVIRLYSFFLWFLYGQLEISALRESCMVCVVRV